MDRHQSKSLIMVRCGNVSIVVAFLAAAAMIPMACAPDSRDPEARALAVVRRFEGGIVRDPEEKGESVGKVDLAGKPFTDADVKSLAGLTGLHNLVLRDTLVTDAGLSCLKTTGRLRVLDLDGARITDIGLTYVADLASLRGLYLAATQITDTGLQALGRLKKLRELGLGQTGITDAGLVHLVGLTELRVLDLRGTRVSAAGLSLLRRLNKLQRLYLSGSEGKSAGARELQLALPHLKIVR
jgi:hypothetical protein